jgi:hypothetical protein
MSGKETLIMEFLLCEEERKAVEIISECRGRNVFAALDCANGGYHRISDNAKPLLGYETSELLKKSMIEMTHRNDQIDLLRAFSVSMTKGATYTFTQRIACFNGQYLPVVTHMKKISTEKKIDIFLCLMVRA